MTEIKNRNDYFNAEEDFYIVFFSPLVDFVFSSIILLLAGVLNLIFGIIMKNTIMAVYGGFVFICTLVISSRALLLEVCGKVLPSILLLTIFCVLFTLPSIIGLHNFAICLVFGIICVISYDAALIIWQESDKKKVTENLSSRKK
jgi:hypothetical protein